MTKFSLFLISFCFLLINCSSASKTPVTPDLTPVNLTISSVVSTDSTGNVTFTAHATNAVSYDFDFGNGVIQTIPSGVVVYKYPFTGNYTVNVIAKSASGITASSNKIVAVNVHAKLYWAEEFNVDGAPDPASWGYDSGNNNGWGNGEQEYYTSRPTNVIVQNGMLKITALKENYNGMNYTSTRMISKNKVAFTYGKVEIRAQLPAGVGTWPAIWMLGSNIDIVNWPSCGEIDIMEQKGSELNKIYGTLHYPGHSGANGNGKTIMITNSTTTFHIYGLEWTPASIAISVDGTVYQTVTNSAGVPFNHDFFMILNVAMGGNFVGSIDPNFTSASMLVDYIRVYR